MLFHFGFSKYLFISRICEGPSFGQLAVDWLFTFLLLSLDTGWLVGDVIGMRCVYKKCKNASGVGL